MKRMQPPLHLVILLFSVTCKAEVKPSDLSGIKNETILLSLKNTSDTADVTSSSHRSNLWINQDLNVPNVTKMATTMLKTVPYTTKKSQSTNSSPSRKTSSTTCVCKDDEYKTAIMICAIIIAVLVLICAALIICSVALANKVSRLKTKLTQSKRQARSNGDFLSASSILWSSGMDTWQKKAQMANQTADEISLGDTNANDEKHKLMSVPAADTLKDTAEDKKSTSNDETLTIISTMEV